MRGIVHEIVFEVWERISNSGNEEISKTIHGPFRKKSKAERAKNALVKIYQDTSWEVSSRSTSNFVVLIPNNCDKDEEVMIGIRRRVLQTSYPFPRFIPLILLKFYALIFPKNSDL